MKIGVAIGTIMTEYVDKFPIKVATKVLKETVIPLAVELEVTRIDDGHVGMSATVDTAFSQTGIYFIRMSFSDESVYLAVVEDKQLRVKFLKGMNK